MITDVERILHWIGLHVFCLSMQTWVSLSTLSRSLVFRLGLYWTWDFPGGSDGKSICLQWGRPGLNPWVVKIPWRRKWQPISVFLPGKSHGWRSLAGYSPWGGKELGMTEWLHFFFCIEPIDQDDWTYRSRCTSWLYWVFQSMNMNIYPFIYFIFNFFQQCFAVFHI